MNLEYRAYNESRLLPPDESDSKTLRGYAAVFNQTIEMPWGWNEVIRRGAFSKTINDGADVFAFWSHDERQVLARRKNGSLAIEEDETGLRVSITPDLESVVGADAMRAIRSGLVDKMSFGFEAIKEQWVEDKENKTTTRELLEVKLIEVSPVALPAYDGTSIAARGYIPRKIGSIEPPAFGHSPRLWRAKAILTLNERSV